MNHDEDYPAEYLAGILKEVNTIAMDRKFQHSGKHLIEKVVQCQSNSYD